MADPIAPFPTASNDTFEQALAEGGVCGCLIATTDWATTPLGPIEHWPASLRTMLLFVLRSPVPMAMLWGEDGVLLYNDGYAAIAGPRHPSVLGAEIRHAWPEVADFNDNVMRVGLGGGTLSYRNQELTLYRCGNPEQAFFNLDYSPVPGDDGRPAGVLAIVTETTEQVQASRREARERARLASVFAGMDECFAFLDHDFHILDVNEAALRLDGRAREDLVGRSHWDVFAGSETSELGALYKRCIAEQVPVALTHIYDWHDGRRSLIDMRAFPVAEGMALFWSDVTEKRARDEALKVAEERLRLAVDNADVGFWDVDVTNDKLFWPPRVKEMFGVSPDVPVTMQTFYEGLHPDDRDAVSAAYDAACDPARRALYDVEYRTVGHEDGLIRWVHAKGRGLFEGDKCVRVVGTAIDITARKAEADRFEQAQAAGNVGTWSVVGTTGETFWSKQTRDIFGVDATTVITRDLYRSLLHPDCRAAVVTATERNRAERLDEYEQELHIVRADGEERWALSRGRRVAAPGSGDRVEGVIIDMTERKRAEEALQRRSAEIESLLTSAPLGIAMFDRERRYLRINAELAAINGKPPEAHIGRTPSEMMPPNAKPVDAYIDEVFATGRPTKTIEFSGSAAGDPSAPRTWAMNWYPVRNGDAVVAAGVWLVDISERRAAAEALERANAELAAANIRLEDEVVAAVAEREVALQQLHEAQKLETLGQLTGGVAHDFNNLLTPIVGVLEFLGRRFEGEDRAQKLIAGAAQSAERARVLVQRLLAFGRRQTLKPQAVELAALVDGMRDLIDRSLGPRIDVRADLDAGLPPVLVDPNQLELALLNLCVNARDAMLEGGTIAIGAAVHDNPVGLVAGRYVALSVTDDGSGMDAETLQRATEPFFTTKDVGAGTGLGLSMVQGLAGQSGGRLDIVSEVGRGTTVTLILPVAAAEAAIVADKGPEASPVRGAGTVLLVDDEELVRMAVAEGLRDAGFEVIEAATAAQALDRLRRGLVPDILVTDHMMPVMTGAQLAREARTRLPGLPVLMITGYANLTTEETRGLEVITKPFRTADLAGRINELLAIADQRVVPLRR